MYHGLETRVSPSNLSAVLAVLYAKEVIEWFLACFPECLSSGLSVDVVWDAWQLLGKRVFFGSSPCRGGVTPENPGQGSLET